MKCCRISRFLNLSRSVCWRVLEGMGRRKGMIWVSVEDLGVWIREWDGVACDNICCSITCVLHLLIIFTFILQFWLDSSSALQLVSLTLFTVHFHIRLLLAREFKWHSIRVIILTLVVGRRSSLDPTPLWFLLLHYSRGSQGGLDGCAWEENGSENCFSLHY